MKIILWDIETTPMINYTWNLYPERISHDSIIQDWSIICGAWKELGSDKVHAVSIKTVGDDYDVVKKLREVIAGADIVVHHNGDKFDLKKLNARLISHGLDPLPSVHTVDTLKEAKKIAAFSSNRLDYLGKFLLGVGKIHVGYSLWLDIMTGSKKALKEMVAYNKADVEVLEGVYNYLLPYMKSHPHVGALKGKDKFTSCPKCGSEEIKKNGTKYTRAGLIRQECQCKKCHSYFHVKKEK